jgi:hypothetical protein
VSAHAVQWVTASPLWPDTLAEENESVRETAMQKPALLRFERDSFMQDVANLLDTNPKQLKSIVAQPKTYRLPAPGEVHAPTPNDLKLYQAVHGHFYLVAATLVCRMPGLPEHEVATAAKETVNFVLRRLDDTDPTREWAWVDQSWQLAGGDLKHLVSDEELLPLFPLRYTVNDRLRRLFVGLVPTSSGESYKAAGAAAVVAAGEPGAASADPRLDELQSKVIDSLNLLQNAETTVPDGIVGDNKRTKAQKEADIVAAQTAQRVEASSFLLLDFAEFLHDHLGWFASSSWTQPSPASTLWNTTLNAATVPGGPKWRDALKTAWTDRLKLSGDDTSAPPTLNVDLKHSTINSATLEQAVKDALPAQAKPPATTPVSVQGDVAPEPPPVPKLDARSASWYVLRCVYRRPECGALCPDVISEPSDKFKIASFFDLDAPSRTITISMPVDTSIKDLRKLKKNVSFLLSNQLREQMNRVTSLKDALDGKYADGQSLDIGLICSFSIPIITICALMVLMIFISLLNIVFWWMPFLRICFPIALKAK